MAALADLPTAVRDYLAQIDRDAERALRTFGDEAVVTDDGLTYRGRVEILSWLTGPASAYDTTSVLLSAETSGAVVTASIRVTGDFPGGRVDLEHQFTLDDGEQIGRLTIAALPPRPQRVLR